MLCQDAVVFLQDNYLFDAMSRCCSLPMGELYVTCYVYVKMLQFSDRKTTCLMLCQDAVVFLCGIYMCHAMSRGCTFPMGNLYCSCYVKMLQFSYGKIVCVMLWQVAVVFLQAHCMFHVRSMSRCVSSPIGKLYVSCDVKMLQFSSREIVCVMLWQDAAVLLQENYMLNAMPRCCSFSIGKLYVSCYVKMLQFSDRKIVWFMLCQDAIVFPYDNCMFHAMGRCCSILIGKLCVSC